MPSERHTLSLSRAVYDNAPVWFQTWMVSAQGFLYTHRRWDIKLGAAFLDRLRVSQWWSSDQFLDYQVQYLRKHLEYAQENIPYYAQLFRTSGLDVKRLSCVDDLCRIPLLEKRTVVENPHAFLQNGKPQRSWNRLFTSGTTGSPMKLYSSRESFTRTWSFVFRLREWAGVDDPILPRRVQFTGRDIVPQNEISGKGPYWRLNRPGKALLMSTTHISEQSVPAYVKAINDFEPILVDGYPSAIALVSRIAKGLKLTLHRPAAVITSAETLIPEDRAEIESAFGCPVFDQYASSDTGAFICDCEHGSLHTNPEFGICEVLKEDGTPAQPGEHGEIVATSFCNSEQVFIRYRIGDIAVVGSPEPCACGRAMPRIAAVIGRTDDILYIPGRGYVGRLDPVFKGLGHLYEAQIVHETLDRLRVDVVPGPGYDSAVREMLISNLRKKVGDRISIHVRRVEAIPRGPRGKFRSVVSLCRDKYPRI